MLDVLLATFPKDAAARARWLSPVSVPLAVSLNSPCESALLGQQLQQTTLMRLHEQSARVASAICDYLSSAPGQCGESANCAGGSALFTQLRRSPFNIINAALV
jgi:hypothetical protein